MRGALVLVLIKYRWAFSLSILPEDVDTTHDAGVKGCIGTKEQVSLITIGMTHRDNWQDWGGRWLGEMPFSRPSATT